MATLYYLVDLARWLLAALMPKSIGFLAQDVIYD